MIISDSRTVPAYTQNVYIYSHLPDSIEIVVPEYVIIGEQVGY